MDKHLDSVAQKRPLLLGQIEIAAQIEDGLLANLGAVPHRRDQTEHGIALARCTAACGGFSDKHGLGHATILGPNQSSLFLVRHYKRALACMYLK